VEETYQTSALTKKDIQIILDIGLDLGKTNMLGHETMFARTYNMLEQQIQEAKKEKDTKGKLCKTIGSVSGILIVILVI
ncbi:MAG: stage III sporulation protein AB, partial [Anaerovorax sp.]